MIKWPWSKPAQQPLGQAAKNDLVRAQLGKLGDGGRKPRHVIHFAYPEEAPGALSRADVKSSLADLDVRITDAADGTGVVFEHEREVASADFDNLTVRLAAHFASMGWDYDGWECAVEADE
ncbi:MAG: hypothetical protein OER56_12940 [Hyphomicrobiales bacterium]|nr:hypothetical protein [Hyphomicrobiales bacterium]